MTPALHDLSPSERHRVVATSFADELAGIRSWVAPTPVEGWVARDVVAHLVGWLPGFLDAGGVRLDPVGDVTADPRAAWAAHAAAVQRLLDGAGAGDTFRHPRVGEHRLDAAIDSFYTADVFMHTWDVATAAGHRPALDEDFARRLLEGLAAMEDVLRTSGQYGAAAPVPADADAVTRLAAFIGRDPAWRP